MEAYGPRGQSRRLARLYSDSKKQADLSTIEPDPVPELVALHSEFKIQRERLAAWGKEWGDDRLATGERDWDETFEREGLKEAVHDVLENVKNVLDESERMSTGVNLTGEKKSIWSGADTVGDRRWSPTDRARYEQLAGELKTSIDLLYDISKNRKELREGGYPGGGKRKSEANVPPPMSKSFFSAQDYTASQETLVNPVTTSRSSTQKTATSFELPPRLDPASLDLPEEEAPPYDSVGATPSTRMIAHLRLPAPPSQLGDDVAFKTVAVLIEYAPFDPGYRETGIPVPTNRLDSFMHFFARCGSLIDFPSYGTLQCLGYFEDPREARYGLVYELPKDVPHYDRPTSLSKVLQSSSKSLNSSNRQLPPGPPLEDRFRLAFNVMQAFAKIHGEERLLHKDVNSSNIIFFHKESSAASKLANSNYDIRSPYISSFDLFSEYSIEALSTAPGRNLYRHPEDPRIFHGICDFCNSRSSMCKCSKYRFDVYGLGLLLLEIGLWIPLSDIFKPKYTLEDFKRRVEAIWVKRLATKCGSIYMNVVRDCLEHSSQNLSEDDLRANYGRWMRKLQKCCRLDEDNDDAPTNPSTPIARSQSISGTVPRTSPENTFFSATSTRASSVVEENTTLSQQFSNNPFVLLHATPTPSFFSSNPFRRKQTSISYSIKEEADNHSHLAELTLRGIPSMQPRNEVDNISVTSVSTTYQKAAKVIQRAWRCRTKKDGFEEFKRRITMVQKQWRQRQMRCISSANMSNQGYSRDIKIEGELIEDHAEIQIIHQHIPSKPKLRLHPVKLTDELLDQWHEHMLPRLERIVGRALKDSPETVSIDMIGVGETALSARPTIFITCSSTARVRGAVNRKFSYDSSIFDLRIRRGKVRRSKVARSKKIAPPHRSMMNALYPDTNSNSSAPLNPFHQERPLCGASIGAYVGDKHLPPVSYGGVVRVDGESYGMTVHHLLDAPSDEDNSEYDEDEALGGPERSSARRSDGDNPWLAGVAGHPTLQTVPTDSMFPLEISDDDEPSSEEDEEYSDEEDYVSSDDESVNESVRTDDSSGTEGDIKGIVPGSGNDIFVTQPALDDVDEDFFPNEEDKDEEHLYSHKLGFVYASSGIRRRERNGILHEVDWALLKLDEDRLQPYNLVQGGKKYLSNPTFSRSRSSKLLEPVCRGTVYNPDDDEYPVRVAKTEELGGLRVHCFGRTSGLQGGIINKAMSSVRIYRRRSFSRSWSVNGSFGVGGDSGAWVIDNEQGRVCGHVLAWCERNAIAYICPMEVLLEDIKRTLHASRICLPGGEDEEVVVGAPRSSQARGNGHLIEEKSARAEELELPDIARLDFGDRERLGLGGDRSDSMFFQRSGGGKGSKGKMARRMEYPRFVGVQGESPMA